MAAFHPALGIDSPLVIDLRDERGHTYLVPLGGTIKVTAYESADHVMAWFNREERSWVVSYGTSRGAQVGGSEYVYSRQEAEDAFAGFYCEARSTFFLAR